MSHLACFVGQAMDRYAAGGTSASGALPAQGMAAPTAMADVTKAARKSAHACARDRRGAQQPR
jgi:hypothetical protein